MNHPVFPVHPSVDHGGMSMRQYYKAAAIGAVVAEMQRPEVVRRNNLKTPEEIKKAYGDLVGFIADALIAEDEAHAAKQQPRAAGLEGK